MNPPAPDLMLLFTPDGMGRCLYAEPFPLQLVGRLEITRASTIEFNHSGQVWEVRDGAHRSLFQSTSRTTCLNWERAHLAG